jgi:DNA-binding NtrC family response regulator
LTVLEDKCVRRVEAAEHSVDVRIIATTNRDLESHQRQSFARISYRLAVFHLHIPPLREHPEDVPEIAEYFVGKFCRRPVRIPGKHLQRMMEYPWPGNIRELRNIIERASLLLQGDVMEPANLLFAADPDLPQSSKHERPADTQGIIPLQELSRQQIMLALKACSGNKSLTARTLGISLSTLKRKLAEMSLSSH